MIGTHFVSKTMIALFTIPLLAHSGVKLDLKPIKQMIAARNHQAQDPDVREIRQAVQSLSTSIEMTQSINLPVTGKIDADPVGTAKLTQVMNSLNDMTAQSQAR